MGNQSRKIRIPKYIKNFNIDNRVQKELGKVSSEPAPLVMSPRHPSTVPIFQQKEANTPNLDDKNINDQVAEKSKQIKIISRDASHSSPRKMEDKRPSKEKEVERWLGMISEQGKIDVDYQKYGYSRPDKIKPGHLTLRQFDEIALEYRAKKSSAEVIDRFADELKIDKTGLFELLDHFKPLLLTKNDQSGESNENTPKLDQVFPNIKLDK